MKYHPATQILAWSLLVAATQALTIVPLLVVAGIVLALSLIVSAGKLMQLLRRTRWIMLSLLLIYAYSTPGKPLLDALGIFSPSGEGLGDGILQLCRLLAALAGLAILLERLSCQQLVAGLYALFSPLQLLGVSRERAAVRLALTLQYAEAGMQREMLTWQDSLRNLFEPHVGSDEWGPGAEKRKMELPVTRFSYTDVLLLSGATLLLWLSLR